MALFRLYIEDMMVVGLESLGHINEKQIENLKASGAYIADSKAIGKIELPCFCIMEQDIITGCYNKLFDYDMSKAIDDDGSYKIGVNEQLTIILPTSDMDGVTVVHEGTYYSYDGSIEFESEEAGMHEIKLIKRGYAEQIIYIEVMADAN